MELARKTRFHFFALDPGVCIRGRGGYEGTLSSSLYFDPCSFPLATPLLLHFLTSNDVMTIDLWTEFSFARSTKRRRSTYDNVPHFNDLTSQYPILLSLAENLSTLDLINLGLASRTTWNHLSAAKSPLRLRKGIIKSAIRCEGLHIQPRPQSPHQGTPYLLACPSSQMEKVRPCEGCGVGVCEVSHGSCSDSSTPADQCRPADSILPKVPCSPTRISAVGSSLRARYHVLIPSRPTSKRCSTAWCAGVA